ncbi:hypothetical protein K3H47_14040 [Aeromonas veronii]|uniref:hypothetical protein n=1 Tax=Aeromonas veronii TaxID=654 RepID=UPI001F405E9A|nr:hypothetical protein [Aeromonas veronii]MCF5765057.1 hypothetical protein [Aeromonas veronii]
MNIAKDVGLTLLLAVSSFTTQAEPTTVTGSLTLSGRVVVESCHSELDSRQLSLSCPAPEQTRYELVSLASLQQGKPSMLSAARVDYRWVDPAHTMAIIAISHR